MTTFKTFILVAFTISAVACNKKSEKCTYNGVEMPCDEYREMLKPTATPSQQREEAKVETETQPVEEAKEEKDSCLDVAQRHYSSEKINALCKSKNENIGSCINTSKILGLDEEATLKACSEKIEDGK